MRLIQASLIEEDVKPLTEWLESADYDYVLLTEEKEKYSHLLMLPVKNNETDDVLQKLRGLGVDTEGFLIISEVEAVVSQKIEVERDKEQDGEGEGEGKIARAELRESARALSRRSVNYILFTLLSAIVATAGLLMDSASVVVGSMVIAPLIGPAMASSVGSVIKDNELFWKGIQAQIVGIFTAIGGATIFAFLMRFITAPRLNLMLIGQIAERVHPGLLSLAVALAAGVAGALSLTSGASAALVGVMIAVALIPPAATVGLGIAYFEPIIALSSFILVVVNILSINLAALITLWFKGYRPEKYHQKDSARGNTLRRGFILALAIIALTGFLTTTTMYERRSGIQHQKILDTVEATGMDLLDHEVEYEMSWLFRRASTITLIVREYDKNQLEELRSLLAEKEIDLEINLLQQALQKINP